jgi:hypothetical protein
MNTPEFTAEASIYKSSKSYIGSVHTYSGEWSQILPARIFPWLGYWLLSGELARDCDPQALENLANSACENFAVLSMWELGYDCSADCQASGFGHDSNCNPTGGSCSCQVSGCTLR